MLEVKHIDKSFKGKRALTDFSLTVPRGQICGLLGLNGAGKSTLMKIITGLAFADRGTVTVDGQPLSENRGAVRLGSMIESPAFYGDLLGRENLRALLPLYPGTTAESIESALKITGMEAAAGKLYKSYSLGMKQRLYFAKAIMNDPQVLILDEPFNGIDPVTIVLFRNLIQVLAQKGCAVLISAHMLAEMKQVCTRVCIVDHGEKVYENATVPEDLEEIFLSSVRDGGLVQ